MEDFWKISSQLIEAGHIQYFHQTHGNTQVDHFRELIQSKDIFQIRMTGLHTQFEPTSGHTVAGKEALCVPNTHFHHLPYACSSIHVNQSQFSTTSVPWSNSSCSCMNAGARECGKTQDWDFFQCQPRLTLWQYLQRNTWRFAQEKDLFHFSKNTDVLHKNGLYESALLTQLWEH